jgi:NAD(P)-dependent dehydrogenase (short-subunit alcohol dehydrogenase family)
MAEGRNATSSFTGKTVVVTGSTKGIGRTVALRFNAAGAFVLVCGRAPEAPTGALDGFARRDGVAYFGGELTHPETPAALLGAAVKHFGKLDVLINNAAIQPGGTIADAKRDQWREVLDANVVAAGALLGAAARRMAEASGGSIVNISSVRGVRPGTGMAAYASSKAALLSLTMTAAAEFGPSKVRVNAISAGLVNRPGLAESWPEGVQRYSSTAPLGRIGEPADIAEACLFLASDAASWITGVNLIVDGGMTLVK